MFSIKTYQKFFQQLLLLYRPFENRLNLELAKHDLYRAQWSVLHYLSNYGTATLVELAGYQGVEKPTVTRTISKLEELNYVEQVAGKDKREKRMQLTEQGKKLYAKVRITIDEYELDILKGISEEEQLACIRVMEDIRKNIRE
ncbi:MarR family winged helix-turn-helix transcriptional regulator [Metabacillus indicus]|uniref:MarR family winged helix-turn-helix transcriptional regulator n=1 Tax=Metabacillus indicus TaxID=246786 RepID=UPI0038780099